MTQQRIAVFSPRSTFPMVGGARIRTHRLVQGLSQEFETIFITLSHSWEVRDWTQADLERSMPGVEVMVITAPALPDRSRAGALRGPDRRHVLARPGRLMEPYACPQVTETLRHLVRHRGVRLVQYEMPQGAQNGPIAGIVNVLAAHNVEYRIEADLTAGQPGVWARGRRALQWRALRRAERSLWRRMDLVLATSPIDAAEMRSAGARRVVECPNGTDPVRRLPRQERPVGAPLRALFVGMAGWEPYERGLHWFITRVWPRIQRRRAVTLEVVGSPPERPLSAAGVHYTGVVQSVAEHYLRCDVVVVPVFQGSGTRMKILEAMAFGRPVVSTPMGAQGLPIEAGRHYAQASDPVSFAGAVIDLATRWRTGDPGLETMVRGACAAVSALTWPRIAEGLRATYRHELERAATGAPAESPPGTSTRAANGAALR